jgi:hypothetical protein
MIQSSLPPKEKRRKEREENHGQVQARQLSCITRALHPYPFANRKESAEQDTVKASNFGPHVHFGLPRQYQNASYGKIK